MSEKSNRGLARFSLYIFVEISTIISALRCVFVHNIIYASTNWQIDILIGEYHTNNLCAISIIILLFDENTD